MPTKAQKPNLPPEELRDRREGWGELGTIAGYPEYRDTGDWVQWERLDEFDPEPTEVNDERDVGWWRVRDQRIAEVNDYQGEPFVTERMN